MYPPKRKTSFEKVAIGELLKGTIAGIDYDNNHKFSFQGKESVHPAVRFVFSLDGYVYPHRTRWMKFNLGEKSNLFKQIVSKLVKDARPDMYFDLDELKGMVIKTLWSENNDFQNLDSIFPIGEKRSVKEVVDSQPEKPEGADENLPPSPTTEEFWDATDVVEE